MTRPVIAIAVFVTTQQVCGVMQPDVAPAVQGQERLPETHELLPAQSEVAIGMLRNVFSAQQYDGMVVSAGARVLQESETPFLHKSLVGRSVWQVTVKDWSLKLPSSPPGSQDLYRRRVDIVLDPETGNPLQIKTRWPEGEDPITPDPAPAVAERQMLQAGNERYHGIPDEKPPISFLEAVDILQAQGGNPLVAKQIVGQWIVWSHGKRHPRPMWIITLRGIPAYPTSSLAKDDFDLDSADRRRYIVDPVAKRWILRTNIPLPDPKPDEE